MRTPLKAGPARQRGTPATIKTSPTSYTTSPERATEARMVRALLWPEARAKARKLCIGPEAFDDLDARAVAARLLARNGELDDDTCIALSRRGADDRSILDIIEGRSPWCCAVVDAGHAVRIVELFALERAAPILIAELRWGERMLADDAASLRVVMHGLGDLFQHYNAMADIRVIVPRKAVA